VGIGSPDELDAEALGTAKVERTRVFPLLLSRDHDPGPAHPASQPGPLAHPQGDVVDSAQGLAVLRVPEPEDLVPEEEKGVVRPVPDHVHSELFDEESLGLRPVMDPDVHVIESQQTKFSWGRSVRHDASTTAPCYIRSVRARGARTWAVRLETPRQYGYPSRYLR